MFQTLEKMRQRPDHVKRRIAFSISALVSLLILSVWGLTWFEGAGSGTLATDRQNQTAQASAPLANIKESFSTIFSQMTEQLQALSELGTGLSSTETYQQPKIPYEIVVEEPEVASSTENNQPENAGN